MHQHPPCLQYYSPASNVDGPSVGFVDVLASKVAGLLNERAELETEDVDGDEEWPFTNADLNGQGEQSALPMQSFFDDMEKSREILSRQDDWNIPDIDGYHIVPTPGPSSPLQAYFEDLDLNGGSFASQFDWELRDVDKSNPAADGPVEVDSKLPSSLMHRELSPYFQGYEQQPDGSGAWTGVDTDESS